MTVHKHAYQRYTVRACACVYIHVHMYMYILCVAYHKNDMSQFSINISSMLSTNLWHGGRGGSEFGVGGCVVRVWGCVWWGCAWWGCEGLWGREGVCGEGVEVVTAWGVPRVNGHCIHGWSKVEVLLVLQALRQRGGVECEEVRVWGCEGVKVWVCVRGCEEMRV